MNAIIHDYLIKLRVISKIRRGQRLDTTRGLTVYKEGIIQWFYRKWCHDNKDETVRILLDLYRSIDQSVGQLIMEIKNKQNTKNTKTRKIQIATNLAMKIKTSITGIENLAKTYIHYPKITATLEGIVEDIAIATYKHLLTEIPKDKLPKTLKENIVYNGNILYPSINKVIIDENTNDVSNKNTDEIDKTSDNDNEINNVTDNKTLDIDDIKLINDSEDEL